MSTTTNSLMQPGSYVSITPAPQSQAYYLPPQAQSQPSYTSSTIAPQSQAYYLPPQVQSSTSSASSAAVSQVQNQMQIDPTVLAYAIQLVNNQNAQQVSQATQSVLTLPDGSTYTGEVQNGLPHGKGVLIFAPGDQKNRQKYEGQFYNGIRQGYGVMTWLSGQKYDGAWANDTFEGQGIKYCSDGKKYEGMFQQGLLSKGKLTFPNGNYYDGELVNEEACGYGEFHLNGSKFVGIFKGDKLWNGVKTYYVRGNHTATMYPRTITFENGKAKTDGCTLV